MSLSKPLRAVLPALSLVFLGFSTGLRGQVSTGFSSGGSMLSRDDLTELLQEYQAALGSPAYSGRMKSEIQAAAERVRERLAHGDFKPGDRVALYVQGQPNLPDTVPVEPGPSITLPLFGTISLDGVLRSEISEHLVKELGKMIRDPVVRAQGLMRLSVQGDVGRPGFYTVPSDILVSEALMMAGGPGRDSNLENLRIERGSRVLYGGQELQTAMRSGRTLDQLSLQAGDQIFLPQKTAGIWPSVGRYAVIVASTLLLGIRIVR